MPERDVIQIKGASFGIVQLERGMNDVVYVRPENNRFGSRQHWIAELAHGGRHFIVEGDTRSQALDNLKQAFERKFGDA